KQFRAGKSAGEFEQRERAVGVGDGREVFRFGRHSDTVLGNDLKPGVDAKSLLNGIDLCVEELEETGHPKNVTGVGQLPESGAQMEAALVQRQAPFRSEEHTSELQSRFD